MKKLLNQLKQKANLLALALVTVAATTALTAAATLAWGPAERSTFTIEKPAKYVTFNSITNNPNYGDERNFVIAKPADNTKPGGWSDNVKVEDGKDYLVRVYVHNNASANLNKVAVNTRLSAKIPREVGTSVRVDGILTADNANPKTVWDEVKFTSDRKFSLRYVMGSAKYLNNVNAKDGFKLSDSIITSSGAQVGYKAMDGNVPGCFQYSGIALFKVRATMEQSPSDFVIDKKVKIVGTNEWKDNITAKPGDMLEYRIGYDNVGQARQDNVIIKDQMSKKISYIKGSSMIKNATYPKGKSVSDKVVMQGMNIGNYTAKSNAFIFYKAKVPAEKDLACGVNNLENIATGTVDGRSKSDRVVVTVDRKCAEKKIIEVCDLTSKKMVKIEEKDFDSSKHSKNTADCAAVPGELPHTGPMMMIGTMLAMAGLTAGAVYLLRHRWNGKLSAAAGAKLIDSSAKGDDKTSK